MSLRVVAVVAHLDEAFFVGKFYISVSKLASASPASDTIPRSIARERPISVLSMSICSTRQSSFGMTASLREPRRKPAWTPRRIIRSGYFCPMAARVARFSAGLPLRG